MIGFRGTLNNSSSCFVISLVKHSLVDPSIRLNEKRKKYKQTNVYNESNEVT